MNCRLVKKPFNHNNPQPKLVLTPNSAHSTHRVTSAKNKSTQCTNHKSISYSFPYQTPQISLEKGDEMKDSRKHHKSIEEDSRVIHNEQHKALQCSNKSKSVSNYFSKPAPCLMSKVIQNEKMISSKRQRIKGKLMSLMNKSHVYNREMYIKLNKLFHQDGYYKQDEEEEDCKEKKEKALRKQFSFKFMPDLFSKERTYFRYEDYYETPEAFLSKHFTKEEIDVMVSAPYHFGLKSKPFKGAKIKMIENLRDQLNKEEGDSLQVLKPKSNEASWLYRGNRKNQASPARSHREQRESMMNQRHKSTASQIFHKAIPQTSPIQNGLRLITSKKQLNKSAPFSEENYQKRLSQMELRRKETIRLSNQQKQNKKRDLMNSILKHMKTKENEKEEQALLHGIQSQIIKNYFKSPLKQKLNKSSTVVLLTEKRMREHK